MIWVYIIQKKIWKVISTLLRKQIKVINIIVGKLFVLQQKKCFLSLADGGRYYNCNFSHIGDCCKGNNKHCGKLPDGTRLKWKYVDDLTEEEYIKYDIENKIKELEKKELI